MISWEYPPYVVGGLGKHVAELVPALSQVIECDSPPYIDLLTFDHNTELSQLADDTHSIHYEHQNEYLTIYWVNRATPACNGPDDLYQNIIADNYILVGAAERLVKGLTRGSAIDNKESCPYDLIHIHDWLTGEAGIILKQTWKTPLVATIHATEQGRHQGHLPNLLSHQISHMEWRICYEAWHVIVCSHFMRAELSRQISVPQDKVSVISNGISFDDLHTLPRRQARTLRQQYAEPNQQLLFFVGRITHEKGPQVLIRAMPDILAYFPNSQLLLAGKNSERLLSLASEFGVQHAINFLGYIDDQERDSLYQIVDTAIFPSLYEPFGIVALEAMALGCNLIVSDVGGLGEVVHHMENGLTIYPNDPASIAWAVRQIFEDPIAARQRSLYAQQQVRAFYNWHHIATKTVQLYQEIIAARQQITW